PTTPYPRWSPNFLRQLEYIQYNPTDLCAHAYAMGATAYWALRGGQLDQTVLIMGISGSGKSFTAATIMDEL
ncbi:unnamed protein product, partial [Discosporangium mesarthrocarpum]